MDKYQPNKDMREHDMPEVLCSLWVVGAEMPTLQRKKIDIMTGGHLWLQPVRNQGMVVASKL